MITNRLSVIIGLDVQKVKETVVLERFCKMNGGLINMIWDYFKENMVDNGKMEVIYC